MKKFIFIGICFLMIVSAASCGEPSEKKNATATDTDSVTVALSESVPETQTETAADGTETEYRGIELPRI